MHFLYHPSLGKNNCLDSCDRTTLEASLGSTVLLNCNFEDTWLENSSHQEWVFWSKPPGSRLVSITAKGQTDFKDPRGGRVKAFPYQGKLGNYSIRIDVLQDTDLGWYCCEWGDECRRVELTKAEEVKEEGAWNKNVMRLFYISTGVVIFILLLSTCRILHWKFTGHCKKSQPYYENEDFHSGLNSMLLLNYENRTFSLWDITSIKPSQHRNNYNSQYDEYIHTYIHINITGTRASTPPPEVIACDENVGQGEEQQQRGDANGGIIYENNEHDPTINQQPDITRNVRFSQDNQSTNESQRRLRVTFHRELFSRLRQASLGRHSYVNQAELSQQARSPKGNGQRASFWRKRAKHKCEYENPTYNNSMDQLNL
ncbi:uncharacterized protein LOC124477516 isoform X2 [Hypomesus transpacificus]|uniref:uncharacterized protein LOC124477516 isoform X2 n=1 Tax=Hypomesus transpacificus TaxID=137520 RepID=UPI001F077A3F|nr:uncharacterized protein LOC124477516 isoform X2 [Hypomesus transpacificus]